MGEEMAFIEGINQQMATQLFYGSRSAAPNSWNGLSLRYSSLNSAASPNAVNIIDCGGTGATNTSIWLVCWGQMGLHGIFPKNSMAGLRVNDVTGNQPVADPANPNYRLMAYQTHYKWDCGLAVADWRFAVRLCNIDVTQFNGASAANLIQFLIRAMHLPPVMPSSAATVQAATRPSGTLSFGRPAIYCNRTIAGALATQAANKSNNFLTMADFAGAPVLNFLGIPVRTCDALLNTEARVI